MPDHCLFEGLRGRCAEPAGHGTFGNYCEGHATYFAQLRADMKRSMGRTNRWNHEYEDGDDDASFAA